MLVIGFDAVFGMTYNLLFSKAKHFEKIKDLKTKVGCNCFGISYQSALSRHQITCKPIGCKRKQKKKS